MPAAAGLSSLKTDGVPISTSHWSLFLSHCAVSSCTSPHTFRSKQSRNLLSRLHPCCSNDWHREKFRSLLARPKIFGCWRSRSRTRKFDHWRLRRIARWQMIRRRCTRGPEGTDEVVHRRHILVSQVPDCEPASADGFLCAPPPATVPLSGSVRADADWLGSLSAAPVGGTGITRVAMSHARRLRGSVHSRARGCRVAPGGARCESPARRSTRRDGGRLGRDRPVRVLPFRGAAAVRTRPPEELPTETLPILRPRLSVSTRR
jgi:hypothetical protein